LDETIGLLAEVKSKHKTNYEFGQISYQWILNNFPMPNGTKKILEEWLKSPIECPTIVDSPQKHFLNT
jgi:hypothetical protein